VLYQFAVLDDSANRGVSKMADNVYSFTGWNAREVAEAALLAAGNRAIFLKKTDDNR
jgi:hypothetical protein